MHIVSLGSQQACEIGNINPSLHLWTSDQKKLTGAEDQQLVEELILWPKALNSGLLATVTPRFTLAVGSWKLVFK